MRAIIGNLLIFIAILAAGAVGYTAGYPWDGNETPHTCDAPCTVVFSDDMHEDEFQIDYTGEGLRVWREKRRCGASSIRAAKQLSGVIVQSKREETSCD